MEKGKKIALKVGDQGKSLDWVHAGLTLVGCQCKDLDFCLLRRVRVHHINCSGDKVLLQGCGNGWGQAKRLDQGS